MPYRPVLRFAPKGSGVLADRLLVERNNLPRALFEPSDVVSLLCLSRAGLPGAEVFLHRGRATGGQGGEESTAEAEGGDVLRLCGGIAIGVGI